MLASFYQARRQWHCCKGLSFSSARDPSYFGLFPPQQQQKPSADDKGADEDDDLTKRNDLRVAFCYKIRDWARTTPPEYISRPPSRSRPRRRKHSAAHERKNAAPGEDVRRVREQHLDDEDEVSDEFEEADDSEVDVVDDEDELNELDHEDDDSVDNEDSPTLEEDKHVDGFPAGNHDSEAGAGETGRSTADDKRPKNVLLFNPPVTDNFDPFEGLYYFTEKGKLKFKPVHIIAPKEEIYQRLIRSGLVSSKRKRPLPVSKLAKKSDAEIVGWYYYCSIELLQFFRICHNLKEIKAIVEYHIRWSAIRTLAKKYKCNPREIVKKYGRDLECEDKKGKKVRLMTRHEIKEVTRGVNKRVEMIHKYLALNILDEME